MVVLAFNSSTQKTNVENCLELDRKSVFKKKAKYNVENGVREEKNRVNEFENYKINYVLSLYRVIKCDTIIASHITL